MAPQSQTGSSSSVSRESVQGIMESADSSVPGLEQRILALVELLLKENDAAEALTIINEVDSYIPVSCPILMKRAYLQQICDQDNAAAENLMKVISINGRHVDAYVELAGLLHRHGQTDDALKLLDMYPASADQVPHKIEKTKSLMHAAKGDFTRATLHLNQAVDPEEGSAEDFTLLASFYTLQNKVDDQERCLRRALKAYRGSIEATRQLITLLIRKNSSDSTREALDVFMQLFSGIEESHAKKLVELIQALFGAAGNRISLDDVVASAVRTLSAKPEIEKYKATPNILTPLQSNFAIEVLKDDAQSASQVSAAQASFVAPASNPGTAIEQRQHVIFVCDELRARAVKMSPLIRAAGWKVSLVVPRVPSSNDSKHFDEVFIYKNLEELLRITRQFEGKLFHVFSGNADRDLAELMRSKPGKMIFDPFDYVDGFIKAHYSYDIGQLQRFCIEKADGVCARDLRLRYLRRNLGVKVPSRVILFSDYCLHSEMQRVQPKQIGIDGIHIALCGSMATSRSTHETDWGLLDVARRLADGGVHTHVYPHPRQFKADNFHHEFAEFFEIAAVNKFIHMHDPVPMLELRRELMKYHMGLNATYACLQDRTKWCYTDAHFEYCSSARNMEYLEAGLPLLVNGELHRWQYRSFKRLGVALNLNEEFMHRPDEKLREFLADPELPTNIEHARLALSLEQQVPRLLEFYKDFV